MCALPIERFKDAYKNWRYNPFTAADMAVDKEEDHLFIPGSAPFVIQMLEQPRKNTPTSVTVYCYDDVADFTEVATAPAQSQFRVDYPPEDGEGTGLIEFNQNDAGKEIKVNYKATGSPAVAEFLDTKVSYPADTPNDHQIIGFVSGAPEWRNNPVCYSFTQDVIYHASGEDMSALRFLFKRSTNQATVMLFLRGGKMHQGYYTELKEHLHTEGTLAGTQPTHTHGIVGSTAGAGEEGGHTHAVGTLTVDAVGNHQHAKGTLVGSQVGHVHAVSGDTENTNLAHTHSSGGYGTDAEPQHDHGGVTRDSQKTDIGGGHSHDVTGDSGAWSIANLHNHSISFNTGNAGNEAVTIAGSVAAAGGHGHGLSGETAEGGAGGSHNHNINFTSGAGGDDAVGITGNTANAGGSPKTYPDQLKVYINSVDKTAEILALTALTELGDGTVGHAFITTGTGEMDISALITGPGFWVIEITEPINGKGGLCLLHLEVY